MGWLEDSVEEFRKLPTAGKVAVGGAAVGVALLAYAQFRASQASGASSSSNTSGTSGTSADSALTGLGVPSLASSPADWQNWFANGLTIPSTASDGAPSSVTTPSSGGTSGNTSGGSSASVSAPAASVATAVAHVTASVSAPPAPKPAPLPSIQNPTAAQSRAHRGTTVTFIPTTIRPLPTPGRGRSA